MQYVEIKVKGQIDQHWSEWFGDLAITSADAEQSLLTGTIADQAALYGILTRLRDLSLALVSVSVTGDAIKGVNDNEQKGETS